MQHPRLTPTPSPAAPRANAPRPRPEGRSHRGCQSRFQPGSRPRSSWLAALCLGLMLSLLAVVSPPQASAQGTAIGYQGRLNDAGAPANGAYDFTFSVHDALADGALVAGPIRREGVDVRNGVFQVSLDFGPGIFEGAELWLEVQVAPAGGAEATTLAPRTPLLPVPYALFATKAGSVANGTVTVDQLNTGGVPPVPGQFLTYDGANFSWSDPTVASGDIWTRVGTVAYYSGSVGVGTQTPGAKLTVRTAGPFGAYGFEHTDGSVRLSSYLDAGFGAWFGTRSAHALNFYVNDGTPSLTIGVGGATSFTPIGGYGSLIVGTPNGESGLSIRGANRGDVRFDGSTLKLVAAPGGGPPSSVNGVAVHTSGNVGIGTVNPETKLHVENPGIAEILVKSPNERAIVSLDSTIGGQNRNWTLENGLFGSPGLFGIYDRNAGRARLTITPGGIVGVDVLQIRGGADLSEHFDIAPPGPADESGAPKPLEPGSVVCIDPANPGKLALSSSAYDRRVAGIVSGAGGVKPGMLMGQAGSIADGAHPVALTGRVYCLVDASAGPIEPGDLLTTSDTPGHAMRVSDPARAQGAILGKAMTPLARGQGLVLVLVSLQ